MDQYPRATSRCTSSSDFRQSDWGCPPRRRADQGSARTGQGAKRRSRFGSSTPSIRSAARRKGGTRNRQATTSASSISGPARASSARTCRCSSPVSIKNFSGSQAEVHTDGPQRKHRQGHARRQLQPAKSDQAAAGRTGTVTFEQRFNPDTRRGEAHFAHVSVRLADASKQPLENDGLLADNIALTPSSRCATRCRSWSSTATGRRGARGEQGFVLHSPQPGIGAGRELSGGLRRRTVAGEPDQPDQGARTGGPEQVPDDLFAQRRHSGSRPRAI